MIADGQGVWQCIFDHHRIAADVGFAPDAAILVHAGIGADVRLFFYSDMAGKRGAVGHDHAGADHTVVGDVRLGHDQTIVASLREHAAALRPTMNGNELANAISLANARLRRLAFVFQILGRESD